MACALGVVAAAPQSNGVEFDFNVWMIDFGKHYDTEIEYNYRLENFKRRQNHINSHNVNKNRSYTLGHNARSDWSDLEYLNILSYEPTPDADRRPEPASNRFGTDKSTLQPIDWRDKGAVTAVNDQG